MNAMSGPPMNEQTAENGAVQSIVSVKMQKHIRSRIFAGQNNLCSRSLGFKVIENRCQYHHFSTGC